MTLVHELAEYVVKASFSDLSSGAVEELKKRVLDSLGCAVGALQGPPVRLLREQLKEFRGGGRCTAIGTVKSAPDLAAFYNGALIRYLDFNDSYLSKGETCHPSDNLSSVLAGCEYSEASGKELLTALAVAYQVQCRLSDVAPVRNHGFDHTTQGAYAAAAGVSKALGLDADRTANAVAITGTAHNALRVTRTGKLSNWKGLAYPYTAFGATHITFLAMRGITGPLEVFEGNKGFMESIAGKFNIDWLKEDSERVRRTILKKFNSEIHSQSAVEGLLDIKQEHKLNASQVEKIDVDIFDVAYNIIGGGEGGEKTQIRTKEEADHSLPYILAVAFLDGQVLPEQYSEERILRDDVQSLLRRIIIHPRKEFSRRFPEEMPCKLTVHLKDGRVLSKEKSDYEGFMTRPMSWSAVAEKFHRLTSPYIAKDLQTKIEGTIQNLEKIDANDLMRVLQEIPER